MSEEKISIPVKRKHIQTISDYCLDNRIVFTISPKGLSPDEFDAVLTVVGIKEALTLGMFLKEHKFEVLGIAETKVKNTTTVAAKKTEAKESEAVKKETPKQEQQPTTAALNF